MAGIRRRAAVGLFLGLIRAVTVGWGVSNTWAAGGCGRTGGGLGLNLQPLVSQSLGKVVIDGDTDGELLGVSILVVHSEAPLEVLLDHWIIVAFGNHYKRGDGCYQKTTLTHPSESVKVNGCMGRE